MAIESSVSCSGIQGIRGLRFPFGRGVTPSIACVYCVPQQIDPDGPLTLLYNGVTLSFPDMGVAAAHIRHRRNGHPIMAVYLKDRRFRWAGVTMGGDYNRRMADGTIDPPSQKTPAELATLILNQIGESGFDVSRMPTGVYPRCFWQNIRADLALQELCDYVACEVVLNPLTNLVEIWPSGTGTESLESNGEVLKKCRYAPRAYVPNRVFVLCGDSLWQNKFLLQASCRDYPSNQQKSLSATNIKPAGGWDYEHPGIFAGLASDTNKRIRAFTDVYRDYRVIGLSSGTLQVPNFPFPITDPNQYLLNDYSLETETDYKGVKHNLPSYVDVGTCWGYTLTAANASNTRSFVDYDWHLDRQIVRFSVPLFKIGSAGQFQEPTLYVTTSHRLKTAQGFIGGVFRFGTVGGSGGDLMLRRPEVFSTYNYSTGTHTENQAIAEADAYVQMFMQKYSSPWASELTYSGLRFWQPDGYKTQIRWEWWANQAPRTTVWEGESGDPLMPSEDAAKQRLRMEAA